MGPEHRIAIAGFGNVGQALARLIADEHPAAESIVVTGVSDPRYGTVVSDSPLDAAHLLAAVENGGFNEVGPTLEGGVLGMIDTVSADTLVELTFTDLETAEPATSHVTAALNAGMSVSTTNKGPIALRYAMLEQLAAEKGLTLSFEGTVMSGSPAIATARSVRDAGCTALLGILNGTTNFIISQMERGARYDDALSEAQDRGYAEADPSGDVEGHDAAGKLAILAQVLAGEAIDIAKIERVPLSAISSNEIAKAAEGGERWRYMGVLEERDGVWRAGVSPKKIASSHPLAGVTGPTNAITFKTELLGDVTISGPGAGKAATAYAVISDLRQIERDGRI